MQQARDFLMPIALHIVQEKDGAIALRELANCTDQRNSVDSSPEATVILTEIDLFFRSVGAFIERNLTEGFLPKVHQCGVHCHAIDPCGEC